MSHCTHDGFTLTDYHPASDSPVHQCIAIALAPHLLHWKFLLFSLPSSASNNGGQQFSWAPANGQQMEHPVMPAPVDNSIDACHVAEDSRGHHMLLLAPCCSCE